MKNNDAKNLMETHLDTQEIYSGSILHLQRDRVRLPDGGEAFREVIRHNGAVCVIPITNENEVLMVRQCRYPIGEIMLEIPAGKLDGATEDPLAAAKRELKEETGATADVLMPLGDFYGAPAYTDERVYMYAAKGLHFGSQHLDKDEFLECLRLPLSRLTEMALTGQLPDGKTQLAVLKLDALRKSGQF